MFVQLTITPEQLLVINQFLKFTRRGQSTIFGNAVTDLALGLEKDFGEDGLEMFENQFGTPEITASFNDEEGMVFEVL
jgi:hypothetical protein